VCKLAQHGSRGEPLSKVPIEGEGGTAHCRTHLVDIRAHKKGGGMKI